MILDNFIHKDIEPDSCENARRVLVYVHCRRCMCFERIIHSICPYSYSRRIFPSSAILKAHGPFSSPVLLVLKCRWWVTLDAPKNSILIFFLRKNECAAEKKMTKLHAFNFTSGPNGAPSLASFTKKSKTSCYQQRIVNVSA